MTVTIELKPEIEKRLAKEADKKGLPIETFIEVFIEETLERKNENSANEAEASEKWFAELKEWAESHDRTTPPLSDEATRRENIY